MITASGDAQRLAALEAGADDFVTKPFDRNELLARVASLVRIKRYQDTIARQAGELNAWNRELEDRVEKRVAELERINRLRHFLSPNWPNWSPVTRTCCGVTGAKSSCSSPI